MSNEFSANAAPAGLRSVVAKLYGVVALCLAALLLVAGTAIYQFVKIGHELENISEFDAPLTAALTEVTVHQLEQAILFERALRAGEIMAKYPGEKEVFEKSTAGFDKYNEMVDREIEDVRKLLARAKQHEDTAEAIALFTAVDGELASLAGTHVLYAEHAHEAFGLVRSGDFDTLIEKLPRVVAEEELIDHRIEELLLKVEKFTIKAARTADAHEQAALDQMIWLSVIAIVLGSVASWWVVRRYVTQPLSEVSAGVSSLCRGDLSVEVLKRRDDEIGVIADGLMQFRENARQVEAMSRDKADQDARAVAARQAMMAELAKAFGGVVDAAVAGDFSGRVADNFDDASLNDLARSVNKLLGVVETSNDEIGRVMARVAEGDLNDRMKGDFHGALAALQTNVNQTIERLAQLVGEITLTTEHLLTNAESIASGSVSLASRAEQQASSLEETAATMEEMSASVKSNADNTTVASKLVAETASQADAGGTVLRDAIDAVSGIEESSSKISDIISVIDGIAFQTNLLALNAAVEAARAGDAGKGFAVVASEVRALAQRSSDAATDIKQLIETSATQVEQGVRLVSASGDSLAAIVTSIGKVEEAIGSIASASSEQASGVHEISAAVSHLDEITQSNATLADEGAANAGVLSEDASKLKKLIGFFGGAGSERPVAAPRAQEAAADAAWRDAAASPTPAALPKASPKVAAAANEGWAEF